MEDPKDEKGIVVYARPIPPEKKPEKAPEGTLDLNLARSKKYIKSLMNEDAFKVMKMVGDQMTTLLLAMNDQMLRWLEVLNNPEATRQERSEASFHISTLMQCVAQMAEARIKLQHASGFDKLAEAGMAKPKLYNKPELTPEQFMEKYKHLVPQGTKKIPDPKNPQ